MNVEPQRRSGSELPTVNGDVVRVATLIVLIPAITQSATALELWLQGRF